MRSSDISIECKFPIPLDEPDKNGVVYSKGAFDNVVSAVGKPITTVDKNGNELIIGVVKAASIVDKFLCISGTCFYGGTSENVVLDENNCVCSVEIESVGMTV